MGKDENLVSRKFLEENKMLFEPSTDNLILNPIIKVVGVGGGGGNAVKHMIEQNISGVDFVCANTDVQALKRSNASVLLQLGEELTKGLGAGADPEIGRLAAEENRDRIREVLFGTDMVFITAGMGGGDRYWCCSDSR